MKTEYVNGSDILLAVAGKCVGHSTTHTTTISAETKDRAVKAVSTADISTSLWKSKGVTGLSISISAEGLNNYDETEGGYKALLALMKTGKSVKVSCFERENTNRPYLEGMFVITKLERTDPAQDDSTYSIEMENDGAPTVLDESVLTQNGDGNA